MTAQMYNSFIHHPSLFSSHQSKPTKSLASPFLSLKMSSVGACLRHRRREEGQILCVHFDFLEFCLSSALEEGQLKLKPEGWDLLPKTDSCDTPVNMAVLMLAGKEKKKT